MTVWIALPFWTIIQSLCTIRVLTDNRYTQTKLFVQAASSKDHTLKIIQLQSNVHYHENDVSSSQKKVHNKSNDIILILTWVMSLFYKYAHCHEL